MLVKVRACSLLRFFIFMSVRLVDASSINNNPGTVYIHENTDEQVNLWQISATCYVRYTYAYTCYALYYVACGFSGYSRCERSYTYTCYTSAYTNVVCNTCSLQSNPAESLFAISGLTVTKKACSDPGCGPVCSAEGCLNAPNNYTIDVVCYRTGYDANGQIQTSFTVSVYENSAPSFYYSDGDSISLYKDTATPGTVVNTMIPEDQDADVDGDFIRYRWTPSRNVTPFAFDQETGQIYVNESFAFSNVETFTFLGCVYDRRMDETCLDLSITYYPFYPTPTCQDQNKIITEETFRADDVIFQVEFSDPASDENPSSVRTLVMESSTLSDVIFDSNLSTVILTNNLTVWPDYPYVQHTIVMRINNSESCESTTCELALKVYNSSFQNWNISITNMDNTTLEVFDNVTASTLLFAIETEDANPPSEDSVTCSLHKESSKPPGNSMFTVNSTGGEEYAIFTASDASFRDSAETEYTVVVECEDEHGSHDRANLTVNIVRVTTSTTTTTVPTTNATTTTTYLTTNTSTSDTDNTTTPTPENATTTFLNTTFVQATNGTLTNGTSANVNTTTTFLTTNRTTSDVRTIANTTMVPTTNETTAGTASHLNASSNSFKTMLSQSTTETPQTTESTSTAASTDTRQSQSATGTAEESSTDGGMIAGIVVAVLVACVAGGFGLAVFLYKKNVIGPDPNAVQDLRPQRNSSPQLPTNTRFKMPSQVATN